MLTTMHSVTEEVEQQKGGGKAQPSVGKRPCRKSQTKCGVQLVSKNNRRCKDEPGDQDIDDPKNNIGNAASRGGELRSSARTQEFRAKTKGKAPKNDLDGDHAVSRGANRIVARLHGWADNARGRRLERRREQNFAVCRYGIERRDRWDQVLPAGVSWKIGAKRVCCG